MFGRIAVIIFVGVLINVSHGAKILCVFSMPSPSHYILGSSYARALAEAGHDVTMVSPFQEKNPPKNGSYRDIVLTGFMEEFTKSFGKVDHFNRDTGSLIGMVFFYKQMLPMAEKTLKHPNLQKLINSGEKFDAVVIEQFVNEAYKGLAPHFGASLIIFSSVGANNWINPLVGNPSPPSYVSDMAKNYPSKMTFLQRLCNTLFIQFSALFNYLYIYPKQGELMKKYIPGAPHYTDVIYNASLVLLNSDSSINAAVPKVPNMVEIGGFHIQPPKQLPDDLKKYMDNAKEGVVYFSLGSNLKSKNLPVEKRNAILRTFAKLKLKVLWKWEDDVLPGQPTNVKLSKWLPQPDLLAHPNLKLFITHGGYLSTTEAVYHGKPVVAVPVLGDQYMNARYIEMTGVGRYVGFHDLSEEKLTELLTEVLNNPKYAENAKERSRIMHDKQVKPKDNAVYWTEYVIRHKGAPHLRVAGVGLPLYKYLLLDVYAVLTLGVIFVLYILKLIVSKLFSKKKQPSKEKGKSKKNN